MHRALPSLRRRAPDPEIALHPDAAAARVTSTGDLRGTIPYMSPEQALGRKLEARSDIFSG